MTDIQALMIKDCPVLRLEIIPEARKSRVYLGGKDVSERFHTVGFLAKVGLLTEITLVGYELTSDEPLQIEGVLIPKEDAKAFLDWRAAMDYERRGD